MRKKVRNRRAALCHWLRPSADFVTVSAGAKRQPEGRPKGTRNASSMARDALERTINVKGKKTTVRKAAYRRLAERAVAGDAKALDFLLSMESEERSQRPDLEIQPMSPKI